MTTMAPERPARFTKARWQPKKWEAMHEQMVLMSTLGRSNVQIAQFFNYTAQQISNILTSDEAAICRARVLDNLRKSAVEQMDGAFEDLASQSIKRLKEVMYDDDLFGKSPFAVVDRGIAVLRGVGKLRAEDGSKTVNNRVLVLSSEDSKIMIEGMAKADEAKRLNPVETTVTEVESAPSTK